MWNEQIEKWKPRVSYIFPQKWKAFWWFNTVLLWSNTILNIQSGYKQRNTRNPTFLLLPHPHLNREIPSQLYFEKSLSYCIYRITTLKSQSAILILSKDPNLFSHMWVGFLQHCIPSFPSLHPKKHSSKDITSQVDNCKHILSISQYVILWSCLVTLLTFLFVSNC